MIVVTAYAGKSSHGWRFLDFQGSGFRVQGSGFRVEGSGLRVEVSGVRGQGSGCRVQLMFMYVFTVLGLGFWV